ncbi:hypothetical protein LTR17_003020 [Elasticomyces elasticus]|nr:hypothetical protein LTR17_003020 [Elasticomyces elasticus]
MAECDEYMADCDDDRTSRKRERSADATASSNKRQNSTSVGRRVFHDPAFPCSRYLHPISFKIGPQAVPFMVHAGVLFARCPALAEAWLGAAVMNEMQTLAGTERGLPDEDARIFWIFMVWLYTKDLVMPPKDLGSGISGVKERDGVAVAFRLHQEDTEILPGTIWSDNDLVELYIFCRRHHVDALANLALSTLAVQNNHLGRTCSATAIETALNARYNATLLIKYMIDEANWNIRDTPVDDDKWSNFNTNYAYLAKHVPEHEKSKHTSFRERPCRYHTHHGEDEQQTCTALWMHKTAIGKGRPQMYEHLRETGTALVGANQLRLVLHKGLLLANAHFFQGAFSGHFAESSSNVVELIEEDPAIFLVFAHWLYTGRVSIFSPTIIETLAALGHVAGGDASDEGMSQRLVAASSSRYRGEMMQLTLLCGLADRREISRLRNKVVDKFIQGRESNWPLPDDALIKLAFDVLPASSHLCKYLAHEAAWFWNAQTVCDLQSLKDLPSAFLAVVVDCMVRKSRTTGEYKPSWRKSMCRYHDHASDMDAEACLKRNRDYQHELAAKTDSGTCHEKLVRQG